MPSIFDYLRQQRIPMERLLRTLVEHETPSDSKQALDTFAEIMRGELKEIGASVEIRKDCSVGNHLRAEWDLRTPRDREPDSGQILLLCHTDTVWPVGEVSRRPFRVEGDRCFGPGALDMKGGIVLSYFAVKALIDLGLPSRLRIVCLLTSDEEVQSHASRPLIESEAKRSKYVLCLEPASPFGDVKTFRKGVATFAMEITGKAAHAGVDPEKGVSAIHELARQILELHRLNDPATGTTVTVGVVSGGTRPNIVPAAARAMIDVRFSTTEEGERLTRLIQSLAPTLPGTSITISGGIDRPVMERTPEVVALYHRAREIAARLGFELGEGGTGGVSDANFTADLGIPTLDGLGPTGEGAHALTERADMNSFPQRAALLAELLRSLA